MLAVDADHHPKKPGLLFEQRNEILAHVAEFRRPAGPARSARCGAHEAGNSWLHGLAALTAHYLLVALEIEHTPAETLHGWATQCSGSWSADPLRLLAVPRRHGLARTRGAVDEQRATSETRGLVHPQQLPPKRE